MTDAFVAQTVGIIVRVGCAVSACVFQSRAGVAWFMSNVARLSLARLSLANELCAPQGGHR